MRIYIIRHGETEWNKLGRLQGRTDIPLNETGRELARRVGYALRDIPFSRAISSPLSRAVETARLVLEGQKIKQDQQLVLEGGKERREWKENRAESEAAPNVVTDERLQEMSFGIYEGYTAASNHFPATPGYPAPDAEFHNFFDMPARYHAPQGGESFEQLLARTGDFLRELAGMNDADGSEDALNKDGMHKERKKQENWLISAHGATSRALLANIKGTPLEDFWKQGVPKNCSVSIAETENGGWRLLEQDVIYY